MLLLLRSPLKRCRRFPFSMAADGRAPIKPHHQRTRKWDPHVALVLLLPTPSAVVLAIAADEAHRAASHGVRCDGEESGRTNGQQRLTEGLIIM
uniref:Uncharacterized protein n=1 Tax=Arundo donax TaxID=35708 RepID=A0A0A9FDR0_ARUDO